MMMPTVTTTMRLCCVVLLLLLAMASAIGTGSYRIRSRPPTTSQQQQQQRQQNKQQPAKATKEQHGGGGATSSTTSSMSWSSTSRKWQDVYIAGFLALSDHDIEATLGMGVMPAITLALRHLADSNFLHDYRLHLLYNDTQVK